MKRLFTAVVLCAVGLTGAALNIEGGGILIIIGVVLLVTVH